MKIEGIPDGWELVRIGQAMPGDHWIGGDGRIDKWGFSYPSALKNYIIIRKIEKPKRFRAFANAAEFEPHRDRWIKRSYDGRTNAKGCFKVCGYDDRGVFNVSLHESYEAMFEQGRQFDDGTPFGIEVTE